MSVYSYAIQVITKVSNGNYLPGVHCTVYNEDGDFVNAGDSGLDGIYNFSDDREAAKGPGQYRVRCEKQLYYPAEAFLTDTATPEATAIMISRPPWDAGEGVIGG